MTLDPSIGDCGRMALAGYAADGTLIAVTGEGGTAGGWLQRIDPVTLAVEKTQRAHHGSPKASSLSPSGRLVATAAADGTIRVWDAATLELVHQMSVDGQAQGVAFLDEARLAVVPQRGDLVVFDLDAATLLSDVRASIQRGFTSEECQRFGFVECPTLEVSRGNSP